MHQVSRNVAMSDCSHHAAAASRVPYMARCNRRTMTGGSFASGGGSTYNSRNTSLHRCAFFTSMKLSFNGQPFRDTLLVMASENRNLTASRCEEVNALLLRVVALLHLLRHQPATNFWRRFVPFICADLSRLDHCVRTQLGHDNTPASRSIQLIPPHVLL